MSKKLNLHSKNHNTPAIRLVYFVAGLSNLIRIQASVQIIPIEILAVILSLLAFLRRSNNSCTIQNSRILKYLNIYCVISLLNQILVDQIQNVVFFETLKSIAQIVVLWSLLRVAIIYISPDVFRFISYVSGYLLSILLQLLINPSPSMQIDPWKFALGPAFTGAFFLIYKSNKAFRGRSLLLILMIVTDVYLGSRSLAMFTILALAITSRNVRIRSHFFLRNIWIGFTLAILLFGIERIYYQLSTDGTFGQTQQLKSLDQYQAGPIILTGRSEFAFELSAIVQNPLLGNGSSPTLSYEVLNRTQKINSLLGVKTELTNAYKSTLQDGKVPQHSMLFGAWVEGGILSFAFWVICLVWTVRKFVVMPKRLPPLGHFATYVGLSTLWAIIFSPLGAGSRMELVIGLAALQFQSKIGDDADKT